MTLEMEKRAPIDPAIAPLIDRFDKALNVPGITIEQMRQAYSKVLAEQGKPAAPVDTRDLFIPTRHGLMKARLYRPVIDARLPLVLYIHGGGFVLGDIDGLDTPLHVVAHQSGCAILSIDYALAPEAPYPIPFEQCQDALVWAVDHKDDLVVGSALGISGDSAGGNLSALLAIWARDNNGPSIDWQGLINPVLDFPAVEQKSTVSHRLYADGPHLTADAMAMFMSHYFTDDQHKIEASPLRVATVDGLPSTFIAVAQLDPLRDEGIAYAVRLAEAGIPVESHCYEGLSHNFIVMSHVSEKSKEFLGQFAAAMAKNLKVKS